MENFKKFADFINESKNDSNIFPLNDEKEITKLLNKFY